VRPYLEKAHHKKGLVEWLSVQAPVPQKKKKKYSVIINDNIISMLIIFTVISIVLLPVHFLGLSSLHLSLSNTNQIIIHFTSIMIPHLKTPNSLSHKMF
jgi:hypothetical protein